MIPNSFVFLLALQFWSLLAVDIPGIPTGNLTGIPDPSFDTRVVTFFLYRGETRNNPQQLFPNNATSLQLSNFNRCLNTTFFIHGFQGNYTAYTSQAIKNGLLDVSDRNIILASYGPISNNYTTIYNNAPAIGAACAALINDLYTNAGLKPSRFEIVGHSVGAQIAGFIPKRLIFIVRRLVGLDPAGPGYRTVGPQARLSTDDAPDVDCILTSPVLGIRESICTVNYYPNGGINQPVCAGATNEPVVGACSHFSSVPYFIQTRLNPTEFPAFLCPNALSAQNNLNCASATNVFMGSTNENRPPPGSYFVPIPASASQDPFIAGTPRGQGGNPDPTVTTS